MRRPLIPSGNLPTLRTLSLQHFLVQPLLRGLLNTGNPLPSHPPYQAAGVRPPPQRRSQEQPFPPTSTAAHPPGQRWQQEGGVGARRGRVPVPQHSCPLLHGWSAAGVLNGKNMMLVLMVSSSPLWDPLEVIVRCSLTFLHLVFSPLVCSSTLNMNLLYTVSFPYFRYYLFVSLVTPKPSFV